MTHNKVFVFQKLDDFNLFENLFQDKNQKCANCKKAFSCQNELRIHLSSCQPLAFLKCHLCEKMFNKEANLRSHLLAHFSTSTGKCIKKIRRKIINFKYFLSELTPHPRSNPLPDFKVSTLLEPSRTTVKCPLCTLPFSEPTLLRFHLLSGLCPSSLLTHSK